MPDPRGPLWAPYLEGYKRWWAAIYEARVAAGAETMSTTPEFGPWMYAWVAAHAAGPVPTRADTLNNVWDINHFVAFQTAALFESIAGPGTGAKMVEDPEKGAWAL